MNPRLNNPLQFPTDREKLKLIYSLVSEFANRNITQYSSKELEVIIMFLRRYSLIRSMMDLQLQEHNRSSTVYIDSIQYDFNPIKKLKAFQRKVLKDFGLQEVIQEIETFIKEQQQHISANQRSENADQ